MQCFATVKANYNYYKRKLIKTIYLSIKKLYNVIDKRKLKSRLFEDKGTVVLLDCRGGNPLGGFQIPRIVLRENS